MRVRVGHSALAASLAAAAMVLPSTAAAAPTVADTAKLRQGMSAWGILGHETALQAIAIGNEGTRVSGTSGYDESADYVARRAARAGLTVSRQEFTYPYGAFLGDVVQPKLQVWGRDGFENYDAGIVGAIPGGDFGTAVNSGAGDVVGRVWAVDLVLPPTAAPSSTSGCEPADFAGMPSGSIALLQRGTCNYSVKVANAAAAGARAAIIFNEGNPGREGPIFAGVGPDAADPTVNAAIPVVTTPYALGASFADSVASGRTGTLARVKAEWFVGELPTSNVIAETKGGDPDNVIVVGAHLDSVGTGPGINDNGSGSAGILELAEQLEGKRLKNKLRFVWFGAEESGLIGSYEYVESLPPEEQARIGAMLNFDMIGSPNYVRFVYDGDLSDTEPDPTVPLDPAALPGSAIIEDVFLEFFAAKGLATEPTAFDGRSDYGPFIEYGIPAGGLFTGAEGIKTEAEAATYGGEAGEPYDPCYHLSCDNLGNLSLTALEQMGDAAAHAAYVLAQRPKLPRGEAAPVTLQQRTAAGSRPDARALHGHGAEVAVR
jgi:Zn-dependent M28 family amino/carboxypeptidase